MMLPLLRNPCYRLNVAAAAGAAGMALTNLDACDTSRNSGSQSIGRRPVFSDSIPNADEVPQFAITPEQKARRRTLLVDSSPVVQMLIGNAIGDAFGFGIEMQDAYWIRREVVMPPKVKEWPMMPWTPPWWNNKMHGMYSDDCEMTVGLMNGLAQKGHVIDAQGMLQVWKNEWDLSARRPAPTDAGLQTPQGTKRMGHGSIVRYWTGTCSIENLRAGQAMREDPGNAPPMRSLPLGFVRNADREHLCRAAADATHPHPKARAASYLIASAAHWMIVRKGDKQQIIRKVLGELRSSDLHDMEVEEYLMKIDTLPDWHSYGPRFKSMPVKVHNLLCGPQPIRTTPVRCGLDSDAMRTAGCVLYAIKWHRGPMDALTAAIDVGGDVDSTAALILGLVGGSDGLQFGCEKGLPWWMLEELEGVEYLISKANAFERWLMAEGLLTF
eukprot:gnl/MRDRNA2_/MRDRNA2_153553_c0_seq1.p1 gnl/MRDRNA2_/MRDRNA2_153553_c0~~gnl/MRDRNA2_/MRDRNA2_153553_c0_seq1.p1  ORF type:complete len:441 (-),score=72.60 gnl/MRDRNA2_/MRDRNA2_153553_c0_seq1:432-1754(-)